MSEAVAFRQRCAEGHAAQSEVATFLRDNELLVDETPASVRETFADAGEYANERDLTCHGQRVEVKLVRAFDFTGDPADFPRPWMILDNCTIWDAKEPKPFAYVFVAAASGAMLCARGDIRREVHDGHDGRVGKDRRWYIVRRGSLRSMSFLCAKLRRCA